MSGQEGKDARTSWAILTHPDCPWVWGPLKEPRGPLTSTQSTGGPRALTGLEAPAVGSRGRSGPHLPGGEPGPGESCQPMALGGSARVQTRPRTLIPEPAPPEAPSRPSHPLNRPTSPHQQGGEGKQRGREDRGPARAGERLVATQQVFHPRDRVGVQGPELVIWP